MIIWGGQGASHVLNTGGRLWAISTAYAYAVSNTDTHSHQHKRQWPRFIASGARGCE